MSKASAGDGRQTVRVGFNWRWDLATARRVGGLGAVPRGTIRLEMVSFLQGLHLADRALPETLIEPFVFAFQIGNLFLETVDTILGPLTDQPLRFPVVGSLSLKLGCRERANAPFGLPSLLTSPWFILLVDVLTVHCGPPGRMMCRKGPGHHLQVTENLLCKSYSDTRAQRSYISKYGSILVANRPRFWCEAKLDSLFQERNGSYWLGTEGYIGAHIIFKQSIA